MNVDLSKLVHGGKMPISGKVKVPNEFLKDTDIRRITPVDVTGYVLDKDGNYELDINVKGVMILPCARTLKDVNYPFNININEIIGENDDNSLQIIQNRLEIFPIIWQYILVDVPLRVLAPDAKEVPLQGDGWRLITEDTNEEKIDPRLAKLKDYIKE